MTNGVFSVKISNWKSDVYKFYRDTAPKLTVLVETKYEQGNVSH